MTANMGSAAGGGRIPAYHGCTAVREPDQERHAMSRPQMAKDDAGCTEVQKEAERRVKT